MRAARAIAPLAVAAATLVPLAACGSSTTGSTPPVSTPPVSGPVSSAAPGPVSTASASGSAAPSPSATHRTSAPPAPSPSRAPTSSAIPSAIAPTHTPTVTITPSPTAAPTVLSFGTDGKPVHLPVTADAVPGAPAGFINGARVELSKHWAQFGDQPGCEKVPVLWVEKVSTAGFAAAAYNDDPSQADGSKCQNVGGGTQQFWAVVGNAWKPVIITQAVPACAQFRTYAFPSAIVGTKCYDGATNKVVAYHHA